MIRWLKRLLVIALLGTGIGWAGLQLNHSSREAASPEYRTETVTRDSIIRQVTASGRLVPAGRADVNSPIPGMVHEVLVDFGSRVDTGQPLARLDPATHQAILNEASINLANARRALGLAQRRVEQARTLQAQGLVAQVDLDRAVGEFEQAEGSAKIAEAAVDRSSIDLERCIIRAPIDGIVISRTVDVGQTVGGGGAALPLFIIARDLRKMHVEASVSEADIGSVKRGQEVTFSVDAFPDRTFPGKVALVRSAVSIDQSVVTYPTIITADNPAGDLKPGMTANVSIILAKRDDALTIPSKALRFTPPGADKRRQSERDATDSKSSVNGEASERAVVYRLPAGGSPEGATAALPEPVSIATGLSDGSRVEVIEGLSEGDRLVVGMRSSEEKRGWLSWLPEVLTGSRDRDGK